MSNPSSNKRISLSRAALYGAFAVVVLWLVSQAVTEVLQWLIRGTL
jgi:hypothetical protein